MRPPPQDLSVSHLLQVRQLRLRQQDDIAFREELRTCPQPRDVWPELLVGHAETLTVTTLKVDAIPKVSGDPLDVQRMNREPPLVLLPRPGDDSEAKPCYVPWCADEIHGITYPSYRQLAGSARQRMRPVVTSGG